MAHALETDLKTNKFKVKEELLEKVFRESFRELGDLYNCDIKYDTRINKYNDNVIIEINQKHTNNRITIKNQNINMYNNNEKVNIETIEFSLTKNNIPSFADKKIDNFERLSHDLPREINECGYYSRYVVDNEIKNIYEYITNPPPSTSTRHVGDFNRVVSTFNPYKFINMLLNSLGAHIHINRELPFDKILEIINIIDITKIRLDEYTTDQLKENMDKTLRIFSSKKIKDEYDLLLEQLIRYSLHKSATTIEGVDKHHPIIELYKTNIPSINRTAFSLAQYYPDFIFTKSSVSYPRKDKFITHEYIDVIPKTLYGPFNVSDLYVHYFPEIRYTKSGTDYCKHEVYRNRYAYDIFELSKPENISYAFDLMELAKSIIFTFTSLTIQLLQEKKRITKDKDIAKNKNEYNLIIPLCIYNVYPTLPWVNESNILLSKKLTINYRFYKQDSKLKHEETITVGPGESCVSEYFMPCREAPFKFELFDGIVNAPLETNTKQEFNGKQIYTIQTIPDKSPSEGFENILSQDNQVRDRLQRILAHPIDIGLTKRINNTFFGENEPRTISEHIEKKIIPDFDEPLTSMTAFPAPARDVKTISTEAQQVQFEKMRKEGEERRKVEEKSRKVEEERRKKSVHPKQVQISKESVIEEEESDKLYNMQELGLDKIERSNHSDLIKLLDTYIKRSKETYELIKKYEAYFSSQPVDDNPVEKKGKNRQTGNTKKENFYDKAKKTQEKQPSAHNDLRAKIEELTKENETYNIFIDRINEKLGKKSGKIDYNVGLQSLPSDFEDFITEGYKGNKKNKAKEKYLKYKAKYLALKQQYNL